MGGKRIVKFILLYSPTLRHNFYFILRTKIKITQGERGSKLILQRKSVGFGQSSPFALSVSNPEGMRNVSKGHGVKYHDNPETIASTLCFTIPI